MPHWTRAVRNVEGLGADTIVYLDIQGLGKIVVRTDDEMFPKVDSICGASPIPGREFRFM